VQARAKERLERVLDAAELVFAEVGFEAATTNQIAARAETSIGSIYEFLGNKAAIAQALSERYLTEFSLAEEARISSSGADAVVASLVDLVAGFHARHVGLGALLASSKGSEDLQAARDALHAGLVTPIEQLIVARRGPADPARRRVVAEMCARIVWPVVGEVALLPPEDRAASLAELKLALTSYLAMATPRP
jgi:AcrR family transcriptional regulator